MMKKLFVTFLLSVFFVLTHLKLFSQGHDISFTLRPYKNQYLYLGYYYGKMKALADSVRLDEKSSGSFRGKEPLPGGIYFIVSPKREILFEVLVDKEQKFKIVADTTNLPASVQF